MLLVIAENNYDKKIVETNEKLVFASQSSQSSLVCLPVCFGAGGGGGGRGGAHYCKCFQPLYEKERAQDCELLILFQNCMITFWKEYKQRERLFKCSVKPVFKLVKRCSETCKICWITFQYFCMLFELVTDSLAGRHTEQSRQISFWVRKCVLSVCLSD